MSRAAVLSLACRAFAWMLALSTPLAAGCDFKERAPLRIRFEKGAWTRWESEETFKIDQDILGFRRGFSAKTRLKRTFLVARVEPGGEAAWIRATLDAIRFEASREPAAPDQPRVHYDSESLIGAPATPEGASLAAMAGRSFYLKMTSAGRIIETRGLDAIIADALEAARSQTAGRSDPWREAAPAPLSSVEAVRLGLERELAFYPLHPVGEQDRWTGHFPVEGVASLSIARTFALKERREDGSVLADWRSKLTSGPKAPTAEMGGAALGFSFSGTGEGAAEIGGEFGWIVSARFSETASGEASVAAPVGWGAPNKLAWPIAFALETELRAVDSGRLSAELIAKLEEDLANHLAQPAGAAPAPDPAWRELKPLDGVDAAFDRCAEQLQARVEKLERDCDALAKPILEAGGWGLGSSPTPEAIAQRLKLIRQARNKCAETAEALRSMPKEIASLVRLQPHPREWDRVFTAELTRLFRLRPRAQLRELERDACDSIILGLELVQKGALTGEAAEKFIQAVWDAAEKLRRRQEWRAALGLDRPASAASINGG
jgi:hypothetical protein